MRSAPRIAAFLVLIAIAALGAACGSESAKTVNGEGYSFRLPDGWNDRSDSKQAKDVNVIGFSPDTVVTGDRTEGFATNVNVIRQGSLAQNVSARDVASASVRVLRNPRLLGPEAARQLSGFKVGDFSRLEQTRLDGEPAVRYTYTATRDGRLLRLRQVIAVHAGAAFNVTFTALRDRFDETSGALEPLLSSWNWD